MFDQNINILLVDDMKTMRALVKKTCMNLGFKNFTEAVDGKDAWEKLTTPGSKFDLVLSDWNMPNLQGIELLKKVRAEESTKNIPFLLITAENEAGQVQEAIVAGVDNYLIKPFSANDLKSRLEAIYKKRYGSNAA
ncbi:MAG: response regulator [Pseudobdellovibrionaceae bacterium]|nr:response regulator [Bdellovibrionales bacterium]USN48316.1 MAG: response regulator [Pseudobdellovibrionaceae bacterium]